MHSPARIIEFGECALLVNLEQVISPVVNDQVHALDRFVRRHFAKAITYTIPAYCSLTIGYNRDTTTPESLKSIIERFLNELAKTSQLNVSSKNKIEIPVCFHDDFAPDRERMCQHTGLNWQQLTSGFCARDYQVYMIGFVAGFPYLGKLQDGLACPRHEVPRKRVERGSVAIAEAQCGVYPIESPGGWNIIGRTPLSLIGAGGEDPFLLHPADVVRFIEIPRSDYDSMAGGDMAGPHIQTDRS